MASSKCKGFLRKKRKSELDMVVRSLRKENAYLKKTLSDLSRQHSEHYKLVERFLSLESVRLESPQQLVAKDEKTALPSEQLSKKGGNPKDVVRISGYATETEEIKNKLDSESAEQASNTKITELQNHLRDALEKNKQWLEYDQQREAYVRAIMARMLWLEKQLNEANQARSQQHNEDHSDEKGRIRQMQEHYERLLQKAKDKLKVLKEQVDITQQNLIITQNWYKGREMEVEELKQQLQTEQISRKSATEDHHCSEDEEQQLRDEIKELQCRLDEEKRRSASFELQANLAQKFMLNRHYADQEKIADLERQIKISSQDLADEMQDCSYLKKQMVRVLKMLQKTKDHLTKQSKRDQQDCNSSEATHPPSQLSRDSLMSSTHSSLLNESFLECPSCQAEYPASQYRELMNHLEICLD
ncbi:centrosomal protein of 55 kDa-like isoform X2 [Xiphias gladius]|uniref:centrosomal protein of 55 kDa-like isoform X2 n=1 Tax=Xiphias gladius TaxID=8245 RepID=UPI001A998533|nr:centrosomal protein of 55 kDa-like isoform X2 [Xiphias gladius]